MRSQLDKENFSTFPVVVHDVPAAGEEVHPSPDHQPPLTTALVLHRPHRPTSGSDDLEVRGKHRRLRPGARPGTVLGTPSRRQGDQDGGLCWPGM